jgi:capsular polysaccharide biosynthesis protein
VRSLFPEITGGPEKVYLRRGTTGRRVLVNEPELEAALAKEGFVSVQPGQMTIVEQAQFLSGARCVVAPHGAALTNMVFAPPGATLVELFHPQHKNHCYVNLAAACGHYYACLDGRVVSRGEDRDSEYGIDVSAVLETLKRTV